MAARKPAKKTTKSSTKARKGFTEEERAAMKDRARELRAGKEDGEGAVLAKIAEMSAADRAAAGRFHAIVRANAPDLTPKLWYGMPAYATKGGKVVCHFQSASKFKTRYSTIGFSDQSNLDEGNLWATGFALKTLTPADEARIAALVKKAVS
jgi:uncharacterized protein YdhG (YjbR/CyaY superfamily)